MSSLRARHANCSVVGCKDQHKCLYAVPATEEQKIKWLRFIYNEDVVAAVRAGLYVCANHFTSDCFRNEGQYKAGFASTLTLVKGSVPTIRDPATAPESLAITSSSRDVACQTDPPDRRTASTQLSLRTLQPHFRSLGVQVSCKDFGVGTSTAAADHSSFVKRPSKRPRLDLEEEPELEDDPSEGSSSVAASKGQHPTYDPAESATAPSESTLLSQESSTPTHKSRKYIVYESCIMELFAACPVCTRACDVRTRRLGTFLSVEQRCPQCKFCRHWNSQPILGSTPAGNLHLSAAVYLSGASFSKISRVNDVQLYFLQF
uniref:THAP-type domain-containing protein n=1 Tax=Sparus aurata TaxID=8175 RepID=A0A671XVK2_SPAAU